MFKLKPVNKHLAVAQERSAFTHLFKTVAKRNYRIGFLATALLSIGGFMMMPFGSAFAINNLLVTPEELPMLFMVSGLSALLVMPLIGKLSDKFDKYKIFGIATFWMMIMITIYTNLSAIPFVLVIFMNVLMMMGIMSRMVPSGALTTGLPEMQDRGAFMSINASLQQIAGGVAAAVAGTIVVQKTKFSPLEHYNTLGYIIVVVSCISLLTMYRVDLLVKKKLREQKL